MSDYFRRLKDHNGWGTMFIISMLGILAGSGNKSFEHWWQGGIFGGLFAGLFCLFVILFTNEKR